MDVVFKISITLFIVGILTFMFWLCIGMFFGVYYSRYMKVASVSGGILAIIGIALFTLNILVSLCI